MGGRAVSLLCDQVSAKCGSTGQVSSSASILKDIANELSGQGVRRSKDPVEYTKEKGLTVNGHNIQPQLVEHLGAWKTKGGDGKVAGEKLGSFFAAYRDLLKM